MTGRRRAVFVGIAIAIGVASAVVLSAVVYLFGVKHYHYTAVRPIFHFAFVRAYLFDWKFRRLVELIDVEEAQHDDAFASVWDTSEGTLLSRKIFQPVEMYGVQKYMYNPNLVKLTFRLDVDGFERTFSLVDSPPLRKATVELGATHVRTASYDRFGFRHVDAGLTDHCDASVLFLGDSFTDGVDVDDGQTAVSRYGHVARERAHIAACPINTGVDGYGTLEESFVLEHYFESLGSPRVVIVMHFPNDVSVDPERVIHATMPEASRAWEESLRYLRRIAEFLRQREARMVVAAIPLGQQSKEPYTRRNYQDVLRSFCEKEGIRFVDLLDGLSGRDAREIYLPGDPHWTVQGHEAVAEILYEQTKDLLAASTSEGQPRRDRKTP